MQQIEVKKYREAVDIFNVVAFVQHQVIDPVEVDNARLAGRLPVAGGGQKPGELSARFGHFTQQRDGFVLVGRVGDIKPAGNRFGQHYQAHRAVDLGRNKPRRGDNTTQRVFKGLVLALVNTGFRQAAGAAVNFDHKV